MPVDEKLKKCLAEEEFQNMKQRTKILLGKIRLELEEGS